MWGSGGLSCGPAHTWTVDEVEKEGLPSSSSRLMRTISSPMIHMTHRLGCQTPHTQGKVQEAMDHRPGVSMRLKRKDLPLLEGRSRLMGTMLDPKSLSQVP